MLGVYLHTDASIRGRKYFDKRSGRPQRCKIGAATGGFIAWRGEEVAFQGNVRLNGRFGPQTGEYDAAALGMVKTYEYLACETGEVGFVVVHVDNEMVINTLTHKRSPKMLCRYRANIRRVQGEIEALGASVYYEYVPRSNPYHQRAHQLADMAWH